MTVDFRTNSADVGFTNRAVYYSLVVFLDFSGSLSFRRKIRKDLTYLAAHSVCQNVKNLMNTRAGVLSANNIYANMSYNFHQRRSDLSDTFLQYKSCCNSLNRCFICYPYDLCPKRSRIFQKKQYFCLRWPLRTRCIRYLADKFSYFCANYPPYKLFIPLRFQ